MKRFGAMAASVVLAMTLGLAACGGDAGAGGGEPGKIRVALGDIESVETLALFIALAKRRDDLVRSLGDQHRRSLSGYSQSFLDTAVAVVLGAVLVTYMIYTTDRQVMAELGTDRLVYTVIFLIAGILRYLQITLVENRSGSPTTLVLTDRFLIATGVLWAITLAALIHI